MHGNHNGGAHRFDSVPHSERFLLEPKLATVDVEALVAHGRAERSRMAIHLGGRLIGWLRGHSRRDTQTA